MKAQELRIGNWVEGEYGSTEPFQVDANDISKVYYGGYELDPIPLTEEWLLTFGFEKPAHSWICDKFHLSEWDDYPLNWCVALNKNNAILVDKLKYVHQLQNLYFALTGEELEIKEQ